MIPSDRVSLSFNHSPITMLKECKYIVLNLGYGSLEYGFPRVTVQIKNSPSDIVGQYIGSLPSYPQLKETYEKWKVYYQALYEKLNWLNNKARIDFIPEINISNISIIEFEMICELMSYHLNEWLSSKSFRYIDRSLRQKLGYEDSILIVIETDDSVLRRYPWHLWQLLEAYPKAEVVLSLPEYKKVQSSTSQAGSIKILAVIGDSTQINLSQDQEYLNSLSDTEIVYLQEPERDEFDLALRNNRGWNILFFGGHSFSEDGKGYIKINSENYISLEKFKSAFIKAIENGLKIVIFNSCDGLGLAQQLESINIPHLIIMREYIMDQVAHKFLYYFLSEFKNGKSFHLAFRDAREKLQGLENKYPCASWLPVICQNALVSSPNWDNLLNKQSANKTKIVKLSTLYPSQQLIDNPEHNILNVFDIKWIGGGAKATINDDHQIKHIENSILSYPYANIIFNPSNQEICSFYGTACALTFQLEVLSRFRWVQINKISVIVHSRQTLPKYELSLPCPYEEANVYYVEIDDPILTNKTIFNAEYVSQSDTEKCIGMVRLESGIPELFALRINARKPGLYRFSIQVKVSHMDKTQTIDIIHSKDFIFDGYHYSFWNVFRFYCKNLIISLVDKMRNYLP